MKRHPGQAEIALFTPDRTLHVCGVDEAGRGPLAGPVYAAAVILDPDRPIDGLRDSKDLSEARLAIFEARIKADALAWSVAYASLEEIETLNILHASMLAMKRAIESLAIVPGHVLVDGNRCPQIRLSVQAIIGGDATVPVISAASILAKTARDAVMRELDLQYPMYGFASHKGYGTRRHLEALRQHGPCAVHRRDYAPIRALLEAGWPK